MLYSSIYNEIEQKPGVLIHKTYYSASNACPLASNYCRYVRVCVCVRACAHARVCVCVHACVCVCVRACIKERTCTRARLYFLQENRMRHTLKTDPLLLSQQVQNSSVNSNLSESLEVCREMYCSVTLKTMTHSFHSVLHVIIAAQLMFIWHITNAA